jgi:hypothetical protein
MGGGFTWEGTQPRPCDTDQYKVPSVLFPRCKPKYNSPIHCCAVGELIGASLKVAVGGGCAWQWLCLDVLSYWKICLFLLIIIVPPEDRDPTDSLRI